MAIDRTDSPFQPEALSQRGDNGRIREAQDASIGELLKRLSSDGSHLVQQEIQLAKTELQASVSRAASAAAKIGIAAGLALPGILALTAALVIGLGIIIDSYWLSALIVGVVILAVAGFMVKRALAGFKDGLAPRETVRTVREDIDWAKRESGRVKRGLSA